jgi:predicted ATPase/class 3 adenylate cyclase
MTFDELLEQVRELLQRQGRVSYRALKRRFSLDNDYLEDLKVELSKAQRLAADEDGEVPIWLGHGDTMSQPAPQLPPLALSSVPQGKHPTATASPPTLEAERRQLTVLFCDLVDSTHLSSRLDPEDYREVVHAYQTTAAEVIQHFDGHIAQYLGDGLLVYFGYPQAHEDDAQRAVHTGLEIIEAMGMLNTRLERDKGVRLTVRVGIHTGLVVVGEMGGGQRQRQKTLETIMAMVLEQAERQPVLFILEDLHWTDPTTLELLGLLVDQAPTVRVLLLLTCRPTFQSPWEPRSYVTHMTISRLTQPQVERLATQVAGGKSLPPGILQQLVSKADGVPLFVEEMTKSVLESGLLKATNGRYELTGPVPAMAIPATLQDSLMARLDRLGAAKGVAQLGATIGRQFAYELLQVVSSLDEAALQHELGRLVDAELLYQRGVPPHATYTFKHALIQDAAYQSLLRSTRQQYHQRIAQVMEAQFPEIVETQPELVAQHYTEAGRSAQAVFYWQKAGQRAVERSANLEAVAHLMKGLEALATLPDTPERSQQELGMQITLGSALMASKGQGALEVGQVYARARELCRRVGETPQLFLVLFGLWRFYFAQAEHQTARELAEQCLSLAHRLQDPACLLQAHFALGGSLCFLGEPAPAHAHLEQGIALYDMQAHRALAFRAGVDLGVWCLSYAAFVLWLRGYPDQGLRRAYEALTLAQALSHPHSLASGLFYVAATHCYRREERATREQADAAVALASEQGFPDYLMAAMLYRGWTLAIQGQEEEVMAQIQQALAALRATGKKLGLSWTLSLLAEAYGKTGQVEAGLQTLAEALALVDQTQERFYEAELYRLQGELLLARSAEHHTEAETRFRQALDVARRQQAKCWELRAATSLSRLWQQQGKRAEARELLAPVYVWFTEGFDTADLKDAKVLLEELS